MNHNARRPIVIKRKKKSDHGAHGSWKIAYADFMTAMMAFFLVMWLLSGTSEAELEAISEYFNTPLKVAMFGGDKNSASNSAIPGGGDDVTHQEGEVKKVVITPHAYRLDDAELRQLKFRLDSLIQQDPALRALQEQLKIEMTPDGLRIQIIDSNNRPMFKIGSADIVPYMRKVLRTIAPVLNELPNHITISGHTDDLPYAAGDAAYSNWELSSDRANAARRELVAGGLDSQKLFRVIGLAATMSLDPDTPDAPINRRISILMLNQDSERRMLDEMSDAGGIPVFKSPLMPSKESGGVER
ncbi:flagellar motor protein MotB [Larsenimonas salina]|uniref:flagellar motor protein MotB n=1 Tax=Larsenimonas salina TaxID=1295565 RepID=UPI002073FF82|nr:flagellar motor protein MotB [Larsenimonas salina]MCM5703749.1 flagellar motor protein MotB [Larsenimonas salina]